MSEAERAATEEDGARALELTGKVPFLWALVALALVALGGAAAFVVLGAARGPRPPFVEAPASAVGPLARRSSAPGTLALAGSGSNLPVTRALVEAFRGRRPEARILVHASIGSGGGIRALLDGVADVALVSRPLHAEEARSGLVVTPHARVAVVVATHPSVPGECLSSGELPGLYSGMRAVWKDGGRVVMLQRERGDSSFLAVSGLVPGLAEANDAAYRAGRWRVLYDDRAMQEALVTTEGAAGIFDLGAIVAQRLPVHALCVDGVAPTTEAVASGQYRFWKDLAFVTRGAPEGRAAELIAFALSEEGRELVAGLGYVPLPIRGGGGSAREVAPPAAAAPGDGGAL
jgi:phosphate transport system substrate-binding protein